MDGVQGLLCTGLREPYEHVLLIVQNGFFWLGMERWSCKTRDPYKAEQKGGRMNPEPTIPTAS